MPEGNTAPNIGELFKPLEQNQTDGVDPCNVDSAVRKGPNAAQARALCLAQGIPASLIDSFQVGNDGRISPLNEVPFAAQGPGPFGSAFRPNGAPQRQHDSLAPD